MQCLAAHKQLLQLCRLASKLQAACKISFVACLAFAHTLPSGCPVVSAKRSILVPALKCLSGQLRAGISHSIPPWYGNEVFLRKVD